MLKTQGFVLFVVLFFGIFVLWIGPLMDQDYGWDNATKIGTRA